MGSHTRKSSLQLAMQRHCVASGKETFLVRKGEVIRATNRCNLHATLLRCKLKSVVARINAHLKHCHATKFAVASWKNVLKKVDATSTCCNMLLQLATTKFCFVTIFEVGGNTASNACQLATQQCCVQVEGKCCRYYRALRVTLNSA